MIARNIMSTDVVTFSPGMSIADAADMLLHYRIHGTPVVDETEQLIGMVSFTDLSARSAGTLRDVMTADPISVSEDIPVEDITALMLDQMVRRVPVISCGRVTGIVSASDIIQVFLNLHEAGPRQPRGGGRARRSHGAHIAGASVASGRGDACPCEAASRPGPWPGMHRADAQGTSSEVRER
jgi:predicted transcriptional regulator